MNGQQGMMTVVQPGAPAQSNGKPAAVVATAPLSMTDKLAAKRAEVARLKSINNNLGAEEAEYADLCAAENAEHKRLEEEARDRLRKRAEVIEAEVRAALPDKGERTEIVCLCDRTTEKRTGIGVLVVRAHEGESAVKALARGNKLAVSDKGEATFDPHGTGSMSKAALLDALLKCAVYPDPKGDEIPMLVEQAYGFALAGYEAAAQLTGRHAERVTGKSTS